jgi:hypothetical protein
MMANGMIAHVKTVKIMEMKAGESTPSDDQLKLINQFTRKELTAGDVYIYPILLCDNEVDRDEEYFEKSDLELLSGLAPGVTGIFDHRWSSDGQVARLFSASVESTSNNNSRGVEYWFLKGWAYILSLDKNKDLIAEIDGGIKKEVSIGFSYTTPICSICGGDYRDYDDCRHIRGRMYNKDICRIRMANPKEMYEYSHVAVPAQPAAGAMKGIKEENLLDLEALDKQKQLNLGKKGEKKDMELKDFLSAVGIENKEAAEAMTVIKGWKEKADGAAELKTSLDEANTKLENQEPLVQQGKQYQDDLMAESLRLGGLVDKNFNAEVMKSVFEKCSMDELKAFKDQYQKKLDEISPPVPQSKGNPDGGHKKTVRVDNEAYKG